MSIATIDAESTRQIATAFLAPLLLFDVINMLFKSDRMYSLVTGLDAIAKTLTGNELLQAEEGTNVFYK